MVSLKVGTDFSGIGSPEEALKELKKECVLDYENEFACEIDKFARTSHKELHHSKVFYEDITTRNHSEVPKLDLYVAGFPCQAFSIAGKQKGFEDVRGTLFFNVADFIRENQPKTFILENVKGLISHDNGRTFQTIIDLLSNCGGTVNGQMALDFFEDGLGYHIYYKVLNTKEHGIPQNRERIFIVGFKDSRDYSFPIKEPLKLKLKDLLEEEVDEKYYLSDKAISRFISHPRAIGFKDPEEYKIANCLVSGYNKLPGDGLYIKVKSNTKKGFEEAKEWDSINYSVPNSKTRRGRVGKQGVITHTIKQNVRVRKNEVNIKGLQKLLKKHKNFTINEISKKLNVKKTNIEHWFRTDKSFSIPDADIWFKLKELLNIQNDEFDKQIIEFIEKPNEYEKANRVYDINGISPTLTTVKTDEKITNGFMIRRLTPLECWRLQGFSDESFYKAQKVNSDTQLYKQAGNSITKNVIKKIIYNIYK